MTKRSFKRLLATLALLLAVCLVSTALFAQENQDGEAATDDGRKMSREAQLALVEAQRRIQTSPDDWAAAREPLFEFLATPQEEPIPVLLYQMLGQFWYFDEKNEKHTEEARKVYKTAHEAYPTNEDFLLYYAITTYELEQFANAAPLFEKYYDISEKKEVKYLEYAAQTYYLSENLKEAKRLYAKMIGLVDPPKDVWLQQIIGICQAQEDSRGEEKYIRMALGYYPVEKKYWRLLANIYLSKEEYTSGTAALEIATRVALPDQKSEWRNLIDLYNYLGLPLRSAESIQTGFDLLTEEKSKGKQLTTEKEQQLAIANAYVRGARVDKAVAYLDSLIAKNPSYSYDLKIKKATILYEARRNKEAMAALDDCIAANARAYDAYYMKGWVAWDMKDWDTAGEAFDKASSSKKDSIRITSKDAIDMLDGLEQARTK